MDDTNQLSAREAALLEENIRLHERLRRAGLEAHLREDRAAAVEAQIDEERALTRTAEHAADEARHRLKNTLAIVQAIANATLTGDVPLEEARGAFTARLRSLAHAHDILLNAGWTKAKLSSVLSGVLSPYDAAGRIRSRGPDVELGPKPALALALAVHELGTNAAKYGALSNDSGYVEIVWTVAQTPEGDELRMRWHERGGPPVKPPTREGFGSRLIQRNLASEFHGKVEVEYRADGLACNIRSTFLGSP